MAYVAVHVLSAPSMILSDPIRKHHAVTDYMCVFVGVCAATALVCVAECETCETCERVAGAGFHVPQVTSRWSAGGAVGLARGGGRRSMKPRSKRVYMR
jgi:hypothetical protein